MNHEFNSCWYSYLPTAPPIRLVIVIRISAALDNTDVDHILSFTWAGPWTIGRSIQMGPLARCFHTRFQTVLPVKKSLFVLSRSVSRRRETCQAVVCDCVQCPDMVSVLLKTSSQVEHFGRLVEGLYKRLDRPSATLAPTPTFAYI
jgi:hypothetical protein